MTLHITYQKITYAFIKSIVRNFLSSNSYPDPDLFIFMMKLSVSLSTKIINFSKNIGNLIEKRHRQFPHSTFGQAARLRTKEVSQLHSVIV